MSYLHSDRRVYAFRRSVPKHLRAYILTATGKPRSEWLVSLKTKDREEAKRGCHRHAVLTDEVISQAEALLAAGVPPPRYVDAANRAAEERRLEAELDSMELSADAAFVADIEMEAREPQRRELIQRLRRPSKELTSDELVVRDLIPPEEFDPDHVRAARTAHRLREADIEAAAVLKDLFSPVPSYPKILDVFDA